MHIFIRIQYILSECQYFQTSAEVQNTSWSPNTYWCVLFYFFLSFTIKIVKTVYKLDSHFWFQVYSLPENSPRHVFLQLRCFCLQLASLALGLRHNSQSQEPSGVNFPGGEGEIFRSPNFYSTIPLSLTWNKNNLLCE